MTYDSYSWTVITFVVVIGSSVVMLLWIVIYSFFLSSDFIDEVVILFGELTFWTTVVFTVTSVLGFLLPGLGLLLGGLLGDLGFIIADLGLTLLGGILGILL